MARWRWKLGRYSGSVLACGALSLGALTGCGGDDEGGAAESGSGQLQDVTMLVPFPPSIGSIWQVMATEQGYFEDEGLNVKIEVANDGSAQASALLISGQQKFVRTAPDLVMIGNSQGHDLRQIANLQWGTFSIEAPVDSGVRSIEDLDGKAIGITDVSGGEVALVEQALANAGLKSNEDVELKVVGAGGPAAFRALEKGDIAAYAGATNDFAGMDAAGLESVSILPPELSGLPSNGLVVTAETLENEQDREIAIKLARALVRGAQFAVANPDEALTILCEALPEDCTDMEVARAYADRVLGVTTPPEGVQWAENGPASAFETIQKSLLDAGSMQNEVDVATVFPNDHVDAINEGLDPDGAR